MQATADVVIVGAGIMGASTAYHLARRRADRIVVVERDTVCSGSTALASGGIRHQYANRIGVELTTHSIETYERFEAEFGVDPQFRQHGYLLLVTTAEQLAHAERNVAMQRSLGVDVRLLSPAEIARQFPYVRIDDLRGGTYSPRDGIPADTPFVIDPYLGTSMRREGAGILLGIGRKEDAGSFSTETDWSLTEPLVERAVRRFPVLAEAELMRAWTGLYEMTPDQTGIISAVPDVPGLYVIPGVSGHGFMHGPIAGQLMAELIVEGRA